jgi:hypothetical protein
MNLALNPRRYLWRRVSGTSILMTYQSVARRQSRFYF